MPAKLDLRGDVGVLVVDRCSIGDPGLSLTRPRLRLEEVNVQGRVGARSLEGGGKTVSYSISSPSLRLLAPLLRGLRVSGSRKVAHPVRVPTEGRVCRHTFSRGRARCQGPSPTVMKRGNFGLINGLVK